MNLEKYHSVYFLGIGGIGMSAIARWFRLQGRFVAGYDKTPTPLTKALEAEGMLVHYNDAAENIPRRVISEKENTLVIYTPAIPKNLKEWNYLESEGFTVKKRSEVLGMITQEKFTIAIAGTHGKTTTSSMIAHILYEAGMSSVGFLGGVLQNYDTNLVIRNGESPDARVVVEADEFDRSFLTLYPDMAVITSTDADHLDIYGDHEALKKSFSDFIRNIKPGGKLFVNEKVASNFSCPAVVENFTYSLEKGNFHAENVKAQAGYFLFDYHSDKEKIKEIQLKVPGFHNVENAVAAISVSLALGIEAEVVKRAIGSYRGVKRRFDYQVQENDLVYIDDYAHHPSEINALMDSVRALYPGKKITVVFQPHLYSRTRDFAEGFSESLSKADELIMMNIYPARELPIEGVDSQMILENVTIENKQLVDDEDLLPLLGKMKLEVLLTVGAGDIDRFVSPVKEMLLMKRNA